MNSLKFKVLYNEMIVFVSKQKIFIIGYKDP